MGAERVVVAPMVQYEEPDWRPLEHVLGEYLCGSFMWMHEAQTAGGRRIHAYKHIETRRYVHLDLRGCAFVYVDKDRYRCLPLATALELALAPWWEELDASWEEVAAVWTAIDRARRGSGRTRNKSGSE
jgi:hypothetical protein